MVLPSIRRRLSRMLVGGAMVWGLAVSAALGLALHHELDDLLDTTLQESAEILFGLLSFNAQQLPLQDRGSMPAPVHDEQTVWQIVGADQSVLLRSHRAPDEALVRTRSPGLSSAGDEWRIYGIPFEPLAGMLYVAQRGGERRAAHLRALLATAGAALSVGLLCALWLRMQIGKELAPVFTMSEAVRRFDPLHASATLAVATREELVPVYDAIRSLGERWSDRVASERAFSAHAAHALRTPLAGMVTQLAIAQRKAPPEVQVYLQRSRAAADRVQHVITALLALFRSGAEVKWQRVLISELITCLPGLQLALDTDADACVVADADLLAAALMNLVDNSVRHGATRVTLSAHSDGTGQVMVVRDDGAGLSDERFNALEKALSAQAYEEQMGLGLMLADLVARAHGGRLVLQSSGAGCVVEIRLGPLPQGHTLDLA
jgi:two-component system OmpR family sensor kinase